MKYSQQMNSYKNLGIGSFGSYFRSSAKYQFASSCKKQLRLLAKELGLSKGDYDLRFNAGGTAVSGEATLHTDKFYVQINANGLTKGVMFRRCNGRKDYSGGHNHFTDYTSLDTPSVFATMIRDILGV